MQEEKTLLNATLCFLVKGNHVLLGMKTKKIGQGCWNGYGGGIEKNETPEESILRELREEAKVDLSLDSLNKVAVVYFHNTKSDDSVFTCKVHIYFAYKWVGEPQPTKEMDTPTWFQKEHLPLNEMMPADRYWLPLVLSGKKLIAKAHYSPYQKILLKPIEIEYVESLQ